ncbi:MAG: hypothetical protein JWQ23_372 [Herminiimonas sp.]|jgi:hypothetical protein|nr:hypothetical protein [Herminiimonas sp.]
MTQRIGRVAEAQHRGKREKLQIKKSNIAREAVKKAEAKARYQNAVKGSPGSMASPT